MSMIKKISVLGFFVISLLGVILHFLFDFCNQNLIVAAFSAVNESVWEHLKIIVIPIFIYSIFEYIFLKGKEKENIFVALFFKILSVILIVPTLFYIYTYILGKNLLFIDILIFFISILVAQIISYNILKNKKEHNYKNIYILFTSFIFFIFIIFTYVTPKLDIFKDKITGTYGVFRKY